MTGGVGVELRGDIHESLEFAFHDAFCDPCLTRQGKTLFCIFDLLHPRFDILIQRQRFISHGYDLSTHIQHLYVAVY